MFGNENEQDSLIPCIDKDLTGALLHVGVSDKISRIEAYNTENLKEEYEIRVPLGAPVDIFYHTNMFYYTVDINSNQSAIISRNLRNGVMHDSITVPESNLFKIGDDIYVSYLGTTPSYALINDEIIYDGFEHSIQPIQQVGDEYYAIYGNFDDVFFGTVDTSGLTDIADLTPLIKEVVPYNSAAYGMYYLKEEHRLLLTIEDFARPPATVFFDIDLTTGEYKAMLTGQHANIIPFGEDERYFFMTHDVTFRLSSQSTRYLTMYDSKTKTMRDLVDFQKELGGEVFIQDIATDGCSLYAGIHLKESGRFSSPLILKYDLEAQRTEQIKEIEKILGYAATISVVRLSSKPKPNGELK